MTAIARLLEHPAIWRGRSVARRDTVPTGYPALDARLPGGGWPQAALVEIMVPHLGGGELQLLLPVLAALSNQPVARWCVWIAPPLEPYAPALAARGLSVGLLDADVYGHSVPRMLGVTGRPTQVAGMIMPPVAHGVRVISIGMFIEGNTPVAWRGTMLHRALNQFLTDVYWGDLDVLLVDLPPGTGDIAISLAQFVPGAELIVVTTPQLAASEVAERAGTVALQTHQRVAGVIENMAWLPCPHCGERVDVFGSGGGAAVVGALSRAFGTEIPLLGQIPLDPGLVAAGDTGEPFVLSHPEAPASVELLRIADSLAVRERSLVGRPLGLQPA